MAVVKAMRAALPEMSAVGRVVWSMECNATTKFERALAAALGQMAMSISPKF